MIGAPWIYSEELEPRVLALLAELAETRSILVDKPRRGIEPPTSEEIATASAEVRRLKAELRDLVC